MLTPWPDLCNGDGTMLVPTPRDQERLKTREGRKANGPLRRDGTTGRRRSGRKMNPPMGWQAQPQCSFTARVDLNGPLPLLSSADAETRRQHQRRANRRMPTPKSPVQARERREKIPNNENWEIPTEARMSSRCGIYDEVRSRLRFANLHRA